MVPVCVTVSACLYVLADRCRHGRAAATKPLRRRWQRATFANGSFQLVRASPASRPPTTWSYRRRPHGHLSPALPPLAPHPTPLSFIWHRASPGPGTPPRDESISCTAAVCRHRLTWRNVSHDLSLKVQPLLIVSHTQAINSAVSLCNVLSTQVRFNCLLLAISFMSKLHSR